MDNKAIEVKRKGGVTWLYFNRPEKKNAMNPTLHREMYAALSELTKTLKPGFSSSPARATAFALAKISKSTFTN